jgi:hypothetical protein
MVKILERGNDKILGFKVSGKVKEEDAKIFEPLFVEIVKKYGKVSFLLDITEFEQPTMLSFLRSIQLAIKHQKYIHRVSIVGNNKWQELLANFGYVYFKGQRYFDISNIEGAWQWIEGAN